MDARFTSAALLFSTFLGSVPVGAAPSPWLEPRCHLLPSSKLAPMVVLADGSVMMIEGNATVVSQDDGKTWSQPRKAFDGPGPGIPSQAAVLARTRSGVIVWVYMDMSTYKWGWDDAKNRAADDVRLDVWAMRSLDEGKTWTDRQQLLAGYCGALITMIQASSGELVVPVQDLMRNPDRHVTRPYVSADDGKSWRAGNIIDLGGHGHHDGAMEATLAELSDGRLYMLLRTNLDRFWEAYSEDHGRYWRILRPSSIDASSAPGYLIRLASGRLALAWNRLGPEGHSEVPRAGSRSAAEVQASWHRAELSLAFSEDDGKTWTQPVVIARRPRGSLSYPFILERRPGELWVCTFFGTRLGVSLQEADFVPK